MIFYFEIYLVIFFSLTFANCQLVALEAFPRNRFPQYANQSFLRLKAHQTFSRLMSLNAHISVALTDFSPVLKQQ